MNRPPVKNLILLHLESVSQMAFWQYSAEMPTLFPLMQRSASFSRFYAASTSSVMSVADLLFGDSSEMDHLETFPKDKESLAGKSANLMRVLHERGYRTHGVQYGSFCLGDAPNNFWGIWPDVCGQFRWHSDREAMHGETRDFLEKAGAAGEPFALYFWNMNSHLRDADPLRQPNETYCEHLRAGYRLLDMSVERLLTDLAKLGMLANTLIVAFGDHGDDLWRHGVYRGRSHIIDPYSTVCACPLFIYNNDQDICTAGQLVSMVDLKPTLLSILFGPEAAGESASPFSGRNILTSARAVAYSQSMFALQKERSDPARAITKSYAVTDGDWRLMASEPYDLDDAGGMEFFLEQWDYGDTRNLLDFGKMDGNGNLIQFGMPDAVHPHFHMTFTPAHTQAMAASYAKLRQLLRNFVRQKEEAARPMFRGEKPHLFPEECFNHARNRRRA